MCRILSLFSLWDYVWVDFAPRFCPGFIILYVVFYGGPSLWCFKYVHVCKLCMMTVTHIVCSQSATMYKKQTNGIQMETFLKTRLELDQY
jgi:hypothetical protein